MPRCLPPLLDALRTVEFTLAPNHDLPDEFWLRLPTEAGVVLLADENERFILIRGIGDPRAFVRRRLSPGPDDTPGKADFRAVTRRVSVIPTGHTLLADLIAAWCEASIDPHAAEASAARLNATFVLCDPTSRLPMFRDVAWKDLWSGSVIPTSHERILGPFSSPKRARQWIERIVDLFDLCRYDSLLAQTPHAAACVYKQMGKCPAPCDGSEPLESYRERFRRAAAFVGSAPDLEAQRCREAMDAAAAELDFERAGAIKDRLDTIESLDSGAPWMVCDLRATGWRCSGPTRRKDWKRFSELSSDTMTLLADRNAEEAQGMNQPKGEHALELLSDRTLWLLIATLTDALQRGLASGENVHQFVRKSSNVQQKTGILRGSA